eukprot:TRINITY_DN5164_c0_g1_i2.p1 TRINITY_DN5164_c0_g1~~TRINITY_DN5164_c0_g1_i2.p1  ORF type:complete len:441 (-),score=43.45 TRINITY_DN5164_c0_g1_i2:10-1332(-)
MATCNHDPTADDTSLTKLHSESIFIVWYCSVCRRTVIEQTKKPEKAANSPPVSPRSISTDSSDDAGRKDSDDSSSSSSDSEEDTVALRTAIQDAYRRLQAVKAREATITSQARTEAAYKCPTDAEKQEGAKTLPSPPKVPSVSVAEEPILQKEPPEHPLRVVANPKAEAQPQKPHHPHHPAAPRPLPVSVPAGARAERVVKMFYNYGTGGWTRATGTVVIHPTPFQEGSMRVAFHGIDVTDQANPAHFVCKLSKDPAEDPATYYVDVEMQAIAKEYAREFNMRKPPKPVDFLDAFLIQCLERQRQPILAVEPYLHGKYVKHTNNFGFIGESDRNTPQAFSHFSYCHSKGQLLICDIQGVDDKYTDPQIHSRDGKGFGKGNMGVEGMLKFFETHRCNSVCLYLDLPAHQPKAKDHGTRIARPVSGASPMLPPLMAGDVSRF